MKINKPISTIIIFVIILLIIFLFVLPKYRQVDALQNDLAKKQAEYDNKSAYYAKIRDIIKNIENKKEALSKINSALPTDSYLSSLVYFFQRKGAEAGLAITSMALSQVSKPDLKKDIKDITFNLRLSGTYESFKNFLSSLDKSARLFEVNSISFSGLQVRRAGPQIYEFNMEVKTHAY